ncbi:hypothetical protein J6TS7_14660 [Paenibacillus dendritiformis]|nr:hypothetical protein J6TS7_14660 [Paenibacillus dendritiformis]
MIDGVSFRILLEDLAKAYEQAVRGTEIKLPNKSDSYQAWTNELHRYAASPELLNEIPFWIEMARKARQVPLPSKRQVKRKYFKDKRVIRLRVDQEHTRLLLQEAHQAFHTEMNDILLAALGLTFRSLTGEIQFQVHVEAHGREDIIKGLNISRTIGWFTSQYVRYEGDPRDAIARLEQAMPLYDQLRHPHLIALREHFGAGDGYAAVFDWMEGESLHPHESFPPPAKYTHPESSFYRFRQLPIERKLAAME